MPSVIEIPEAAEKTQEHASCDAVDITLALHPNFVSKITAALQGMALRRRQRSYEDMERHDASQMPLDILAREHPYMYIKAMAG